VTEAVSSVRARALAIPAWAWLGAILVGSIVFRALLARRMVAPWIMVDELIYSELAKSFAAHGAFAVRGVASHGYGFVYPVLIAPAFRIASITSAYGAAKAINSVVMSLAAVPAYFLARRVARPALALLVALLTVAVPSMVYTGTLMTENAFYPLFLTCALVLVLVLERPTPLRVILLLALTLLAFLTRAQAVALVPAMLTAPLLLPRPRWREFRLLYAVVIALAALVVVYEAAHGRSPLAALGAYRSATGTSYSAGSVLRWLVYHLGELDLYVGVAPFAALLYLVCTRERTRPFVAAAVPLAAWLVLEVAAFASTESQRIEERNMFFVAPLFFVALALWIELGLPRTRAAAACAAVAAAGVGVVPYSGLINGNATSDTLALLPFWQLQDTVITLDEVAAVAVGIALALALAWLLLSPRWVLALPLAILALYAVALWPIEDNPHGGIHHASEGALFGGTSLQREWIDDAVGRNADVSVLFDSTTMDKFTVWTNEFFNRSVHRVYDLHGPTPGGLPETPVREDTRTGAIDGVHGRYLLTTTALPLDEPRVTVDQVKGLAVYRLVRPLGLAYATSGIYGDGWSGPTAAYTRYRCDGGMLRVTVQSDGRLLHRPSTVAASSDAADVVARVGSGRTRTFAVPLAARHGRCVVRFRVSPLAVPAQVEPGNSDTRVLGIRFLSFAVAR
jgi:hypothetical protein